MMRKIRPLEPAGVRTPAVQDYELQHRSVARRAAAEGFVLLENRGNVLPLAEGAPVDLYGIGIYRTLRGGVGSGDVNARECVTLLDGIVHSGLTIGNREHVETVRQAVAHEEEAWTQKIFSEMDRTGNFWAYIEIPHEELREPDPVPAGDVAIYAITRQGGEFHDRSARPGDYYLSAEEERYLGLLNEAYPHVFLVLNTTGLVDLSFTRRYEHLDTIMYIHQPGMEAGNAFCDVILGKTPPSGKLTDTWAEHYEDYPNSATFSHNNDNVFTEEYREGLYVGYRYFDSYEVPTRYGFGYGLSYTDFSLRVTDIALRKNDAGSSLHVQMQVTNAGKRYSGREVVQIYISAPLGRLDKPYRSLAGFAKTGTLAPGEKEEVDVEIPLYLLASYDEQLPGWVMEQGLYGIFAGNSLESSTLAGSLVAEDELVFARTEHICPMHNAIEELHGPVDRIADRRILWEDQTALLPQVRVSGQDVKTETYSYADGGYEEVDQDIRSFVDGLTTDQMIRLAAGGAGEEEAQADQNGTIGGSGVSVPGAAGETSSAALENGLANMVLADGPAGIRITQQYQVIDGRIQKGSWKAAMANGKFDREKEPFTGDVYYMFCTAIPCGTLLAQTWDPEMVQACGDIIGEEMEMFHISLWLAPGMNIHRNPLCGRNFEYYSEDPLIAGTMAAAMTRGVQQHKGCGVTIKHFCCNNQEENRVHSNSVVSERTLREIYLKGFEIAVKSAAPAALMTSYNLVNGTHTANSYDLVTKVLRNEWGFHGLVMTDWDTTRQHDGCTAAGCLRAGNDLVEPGGSADYENVRKALEEGQLEMRDLKRSVSRLARCAFASNRYA